MNRGFTLLEILIAVAISATALAFISYFTIDVAGFGLNIQSRLQTERELEMTLRIMLTEIRSMGPAANGAYNIAIANATTFQFYSDIDGDGSFEQVRYFLNGTILQKGITDPVGSPATYPAQNEIISDVVHSLIPGPIFTYYGSGYPNETGPLPTPTEIALIRLVKISGTTDEDTTKPPAPTTLSIHATIRNLRGDI